VTSSGRGGYGTRYRRVYRLGVPRNDVTRLRQGCKGRSLNGTYFFYDVLCHDFVCGSSVLVYTLSHRYKPVSCLQVYNRIFFYFVIDAYSVMA